MTTETVWFRVEETTYSAGVNEWGDPLPGGPTRTNLYTYRVLRETPCGVWLEWADGIEAKFVNRSWGKRYACPTVEEAVASFKARKRRQIGICKKRIRQAEEAMSYLDAKGFYSDARNWSWVK